MEIEPVTREEMYLAKAAGQNVETPEPITRKEMFLDAVARNGGSGGVTSWNDLTDKPFGESENAVLLPPTQFVGGLIANALVALGSNIELVDGRTYTVNWNGVDYEAVCYMAKTSFAEEKVPVVGNPLPQGGENNGLPFVIGGNEQGVMAWPLDGSTGATVSIKGYRIEPIPVKYLPKVSDLDATWLAELKTALGISN